MKCRKSYIWLILLALGVLTGGCSTQKNTKASRTYHAMKVRYNIFYNGNLRYDEGQKAIKNAVNDDYSTVLPLYPVSDHTAAEAASS